ncbi:GntR family transcriptional regulator [Lacticaseibacillus sp. GG6-2]
MEFDDKIPIYYQIELYIRRQIIAGKLIPGDKLPAVRQLALDLTVNVNTVQRALGELIQAGVLVSKRGLGNFITEDSAILSDIRGEAIERELSRVYDDLAALGLSPKQMTTALSDYIAKREDESNG